MTSVPENVYGIICDAYGDQLRNTAFRQRPISQCSMRFSELLVRGSGFQLKTATRLSRVSTAVALMVFVSRCGTTAMLRCWCLAIQRPGTQARWPPPLLRASDWVAG